MNITDRISKEEFDIAYDNHQPRSWIVFAFKYFSKTTEKKDFAVKKTLTITLVTLFLMGYLATVFNLPEALVKSAGILYSIILATLVLYLFSAVIANNYRIKQIRKSLGINKYEYDALVSVYY